MKVYKGQMAEVIVVDRENILVYDQYEGEVGITFGPIGGELKNYEEELPMAAVKMLDHAEETEEVEEIYCLPLKIKNFLIKTGVFPKDFFDFKIEEEG